MKKFVSLSAAALAATIVAPGLHAQSTEASRDRAAGFGTQTFEQDWEALTNEFGQLGTTISSRTEEVFATCRINPNTGGDHFVQIVDFAGGNARSWFQPAVAQASEWGWRDGTQDGVNLMFGYEFGAQAVTPEDGAPVLNWVNANGTDRAIAPIITGDVLDQSQAGVMRALAYDAAGNGGDGSIWTGNFGSSTFEVDLDGNILTVFPNSGEVHYGMGLDPVTGNLILNSQTTPGVLDYDKTTGQIIAPSGLTLPQGIAGGGEFVEASVFRGPLGSGYDMMALSQGNPDSNYGIRYHLDVAGMGLSTNTRLGTDEPDQVQTIDNEAFFGISDRGTLNYTVDTETLEFDIDISRNPGDGMGIGGLNGTTAVTFAQTSPDADIDSSSLFVRELVHLQTNGVTVDPATGSPRSFGVLMSNNPATPSLTSVNLPDEPFQDFDECVRIQSVYIDFAVDFLPLAMTNQTRWCRGPDPVILSGTYFETFGSNSFNSDTSSGFFQLTNEETDPAKSVTKMVVTWLNGPSSTTQVDNFMRFDTDNPNMADIFLFGNSANAGCLGTYRNNSDVDSGLIYAGTDLTNQDFNAGNLGACPTDVQTGYLASDDGPTVFGAFAGDYLTLEFNFAPATLFNGQVFEFDADTDGGLGTSGGSMDFLVITVTFDDGSTSTNELQSDPNIPVRSFTQL